MDDLQEFWSCSQNQQIIYELKRVRNRIYLYYSMMACDDLSGQENVVNELFNDYCGAWCPGIIDWILTIIQALQFYLENI